MPESTFNPVRRQFLSAAAATFVLALSRLSLADDIEVVALRIWPASTYTRVTLEADRELEFNQFILTNPNRLVVDLKGVQLNRVLKAISAQITGADPYIETARVGQFGSDIVRLVLHLKTNVKPQIFRLQPVAGYRYRLVVDLYPENNNTDDPLFALLQEFNHKGEVQDTPPLKRSHRQARQNNGRRIIVMLDPGHGGEDPGAIGLNGTQEKNVVLQIAKVLRETINNEANMEAHMTRSEDIFIPLGVRVAKARKLNADLFISIHADAAPNRNAKGSSVYALSEKGATSAFAKALALSENAADLIGGIQVNSKDRYLTRTLLDLTQTATINDSLKLGKTVLRHMSLSNRLHKNAVEQAGFAVLKAPDIPSILVETAFISNPEEEKRLLNSQFQQQVAEAIMKGIKGYFAQSATLANREMLPELLDHGA